MKAREPKIYHIKVDWETHQIYMKYRDKLSRLMAGPDRFSERWLITQADYKGWRALKSCHSEFHRILWCGPIKKRLSRKSFTLQSLSFCMCARLYRNKKNKRHFAAYFYQLHLWLFIAESRSQPPSPFQDLR